MQSPLGSGESAGLCLGFAQAELWATRRVQGSPTFFLIPSDPCVTMRVSRQGPPSSQPLPDGARKPGSPPSRRPAKLCRRQACALPTNRATLRVMIPSNLVTTLHRRRNAPLSEVVRLERPLLNEWLPPAFNSRQSIRALYDELADCGIRPDATDAASSELDSLVKTLVGDGVPALSDRQLVAILSTPPVTYRVADELKRRRASGRLTTPWTEPIGYAESMDDWRRRTHTRNLVDHFLKVFRAATACAYRPPSDPGPSAGATPSAE